MIQKYRKFVYDRLIIIYAVILLSFIICLAFLVTKLTKKSVPGVPVKSSLEQRGGPTHFDLSKLNRLGVRYEGYLKKETNYSIISSSIPRVAEQLKYTFYLPVTATVWKDFGYTPVVILTGGISEWSSHPIAKREGHPVVY